MFVSPCELKPLLDFHPRSATATDVVYLALSYLQKWSILLKDTDLDRMEAINGEIMGWMRSFKPNEVMASDIIEL
jgi:hypothetical protein